MRHRGLAALLALLVGMLVAGAACSAEREPPRSRIDVDTAELREQKAAAGIEDCPAPTGAATKGVNDLPAITLPCLGGGPDVELSSLKGPLLINLWASNCQPCRTEMPALQEFHEQYGDQVPVLGIDFLDTYPEAALGLMELTGATYPSLADPGGDVQTKMRVAGLPQFAIIDESGEVMVRPGRLDSLNEVVALVEEHTGKLVAP